MFMDKSKCIPHKVLSNFFDFKPNEVGICGLHAAQRLSEAQLMMMFRTRHSRGTSVEKFESIIKAIDSLHRLDDFKLLEVEKKGVKKFTYFKVTNLILCHSIFIVLSTSR
jgi:hypothetical protein